MQDYIERALEGDSSAYEFIVREYQNRIFRYINKLIKNPEDAQEITQDVFVTGFYKLDRYDEAYSLSTWFYKIAKNLLFKALILLLNWLHYLQLILRLEKLSIVMVKQTMVLQIQTMIMLA